MFSSKRRIIVLRHGEDLDNKRNIFNGATRDNPLTDTGRDQAARARERLHNEFNIRHIFCSPLQRARQTAAIVKGDRRLVITTVPLLIERCHGIAEGKTFEEARQLATDIFKRPPHFYILEIEGSENHTVLRERARKALISVDQYCETHSIRGDILLVSHAALIRAMFASKHNLTFEQSVDQVGHMGNCEYRVL